MRFFLKLILLILINSGIFWILSTQIFTETLSITGGFKGFIFIAIIFGLVDTLVKPIINLITLPLRIVTLGLIKFVINGTLLLILEKAVNLINIGDISIVVDGIGTYLFAGLILAIIDSIFDNF